MKALKYVAIIIACATIIIIVAQIRNCGSNDQGGVIVAPVDTNFAPVTHETYRPPSLPFSKKTSGVELPKGVKEQDVQRVISVEVRDVPKEPPKRIDIIEMKTGEVFVHKDSSISDVTVSTFEPPVFTFQLKFGAGVSIGKAGSGLRFSPAALFAPVEWAGWIQIPALGADLDGMGLGAQIKVYHDFSVGALRLWRYDGGAKIKLTISYVF